MKRIVSYIRHHLNEIGKGLLFFLTLILLLFIFPDNLKFKYEFQQGKPWMYNDLIAPFDFAVAKTEEQLKAEKNAALQKLIPYFEYDASVDSSIQHRLKRNLSQLFSKRYASVDSGAVFRKHFSILSALLHPVLKTGIIDGKNQEKYPAVYVLKKNVATKINPRQLYTVKTAKSKILRSIAASRRLRDKELCIQAMQDVLRPNVVLDKKKTALAVENLMNAISPFAGMIQKGERIISKGELVSENKYLILRSLKNEYAVVYGKKTSGLGLRLGQFILIFIALGTLFAFLVLIKHNIFEDAKKVALILILLLLMVGSTSAVIRYNAAYLYILPVALFPLLLRVFFDVRLAIFVFFTSLLLASFLVPNSFEFVFLQFFAGITGILSVLKLSKRSQFYFSAALIFATYVLIYIGLTLIEEGNINDLHYGHLLYFAISSALTLFAYPLIFAIEKLFGFVTDITLMELSNTNNPLLRELAIKAPGTFQHSMQVGNLAEEAIYEIGGNPLLVRTGAMYHDIGKMFDPQFFIENQSTGINPHEELEPEESAQIIVGHVLDGIQLAKKHKLPSQLIDFIRTHHGTQRVEYFWIKAQKENPFEELDQDDYTYPGPAPFSKETAVLMMADSIEAASRSIDEPDEEKLNRLIDRIIAKQMQNHQFDNANITLKEISRIKKVFRKKLTSIYHVRIKYPGQA